MLGAPTKQKTIYRNRAAKIKKLCTNYNIYTNIEDFLRGILALNAIFNCRFNF